MKQQESKLIAKVLLNNDHDAFATLISLHQNQIRNYARRLTKGDLSLADDIAQETFISAFQKLNKYSAKGSFAGWLLTICYRHFLQQLRKYKPDQHDIECHIPVFDSIEPQIMIEQALRLISHEERSAITLHSTLGHSHLEIATIMQIPIGTVKSHITRGKNKIIDLLSESKKGAA